MIISEPDPNYPTSIEDQYEFEVRIFATLIGIICVTLVPFTYIIVRAGRILKC